MKRLGSSDSLGALVSICPTTEERSPRNTNANNNHLVYSREFQSMLDGLDEEGCIEESGHVSEKKRRLSVDQVKALEKNFEVENKLEPERKVKLAQELGLQPRQVAVWFQNRRARWKTKQLERDYGVLKASYEALKTNYDALQHDNEALLKEVRELKAKLNEENTESNVSIKEEVIPPDSDDEKPSDVPPSQQQPLLASLATSDSKDLLNYENLHNNNNNSNGLLGSGASLLPDFKDGSSDSDSSAILNEDNNNNNKNSKSPINLHEELILSPPAAASSSSCLMKFSTSSPSPTSINCFQFSSSRASATNNTYQAQFVKMEEHNFFSSEEACNFFSDEQPPTLQWYCLDQWNYET